MVAGRVLDGVDRRFVLSAAWVVVLLNMLVRDVHQLFHPGMLAAVASGTVNGVRLTDQALLLAGIALEIPIAMVVLSVVLAVRVNRWVNVVAVVVAVPLLLSGPPTDLDDVFFASVEVLVLLGVVGIAWTWRRTLRFTPAGGKEGC